MCLCIYTRVESFIEHQDACDMGRLRPETRPPPACLSRTASSPSRSSETNFSTGPNNWNNNGPVMKNNNNSKPMMTEPAALLLLNPTMNNTNTTSGGVHETSSINKYEMCPNLDLRLSTTTSGNIFPIVASPNNKGDLRESITSNHFRISIGSSSEMMGQKDDQFNCCFNNDNRRNNSHKESCNSSHKPQGKLFQLLKLSQFIFYCLFTGVYACAIPG